MKNNFKALLSIFAIVFPLSADIVRMKQGPSLQGTLVTANSQNIVFLRVDGTQESIPIQAIKGVDFAPLPPPVPKSAPPPKAATVVPAGTQITVRMIDSINGQTTASSQRYRASIDDPVTVGDRIVIPRGANCTVQVVQVEGGKELDLKLYDLTIAGKNYQVASDYAVVKAEGTSKGRKALRRGVGLGAMGAGIGALAGGGEGAAVGAAVGAGVGAVSAAKAKGKQINLPSESRLTFALKSALPIT
ncbi:MAG: hypothetical protein ACRD7E_01780 [Bryobacteraceae bacterium]